RDFFKSTYGPTIAAYRTIGDDTDRATELDTAIAALADRYLHDGVMQWEYLQVTATVAG
ncbi:MAG: SAM-dependent methyltransferase, partial [Actinomycetota bacterium]|nr:SAM-dependent methyltransferase [Actinomycetota bacterium]